MITLSPEELLAQFDNELAHQYEVPNRNNIRKQEEINMAVKTRSTTKTTDKPASTKRRTKATKAEDVVITMQMTRPPAGKGGFRFEQIDDAGDVLAVKDATLGPAYLSQDAFASLGEPDHITLTITA